jgi:sterol desaturase/sphingolipid hydroxylase (fatty acid hydroxylase superfamily)
MGSVIKAFLVHGSNLALACGLAVITAYWRWAGTAPWLGDIALGALLFFCVEYALHRFAFHARPAANRTLRALQHRLHYDHHVDPKRLDLLFLPVWYLGPNLLLTWALASFALASGARGLALVSGAMLAVLYYEWVHYVAHIPFQPLTPWGRWMKKYHLLHHYKNEGQWFGVTNPLGDIIAGTKADPQTTARSSTARNLFESE